MNKQINCLERHTYAPELNTLHYADDTEVRVPNCTTIDEALRYVKNSQAKMKLTQHERLELRQKNCGSFEYRLIDAWYAADNINKKALEQAFKNTAFDLT